MCWRGVKWHVVWHGMGHGEERRVHAEGSQPEGHKEAFVVIGDLLKLWIVVCGEGSADKIKYPLNTRLQIKDKRKEKGAESG